MVMKELGTRALVVIPSRVGMAAIEVVPYMYKVFVEMQLRGLASP